jgi:hypothetical protein
MFGLTTIGAGRVDLIRNAPELILADTQTWKAGCHNEFYGF